MNSIPFFDSPDRCEEAGKQMQTQLSTKVLYTCVRNTQNWKF